VIWKQLEGTAKKKQHAFARGRRIGKRGALDERLDDLPVASRLLRARRRADQGGVAAPDALGEVADPVAVAR
jgi:hypothetical protein